MKTCIDSIIKPRALESLLIRYDSIKGNLRTIDEGDSNLSLIPILVIQYKGTGSSRTLEDIRTAAADIGNVTGKFADVAIRYEDGRVVPYKIKREFAQYMIIYKNVASTKEKFKAL